MTVVAEQSNSKRRLASCKERQIWCSSWVLVWTSFQRHFTLILISEFLVGDYRTRREKARKLCTMKTKTNDHRLYRSSCTIITLTVNVQLTEFNTKPRTYGLKRRSAWTLLSFQVAKFIPDYTYHVFVPLFSLSLKSAALSHMRQPALRREATRYAEHS